MSNEAEPTGRTLDDAPTEDPEEADESEPGDGPGRSGTGPGADGSEGGGDGGPGPGDPSLERELDELQAEFDELNDRHLRLAAEFTNYRRRAEAERTEAWTRAQADLVGKLLEVLDDLQRVSELDPAEESVTVQAIVEGVDLVERKFVRALEDAGVEAVDPAGEPFDPERMEALMRVEAESEEDDDHVEQVFRKGYTFKGHLVRPARVSVRKYD